MNQTDFIYWGRCSQICGNDAPKRWENLAFLVRKTLYRGWKITPPNLGIQIYVHDNNLLVPFA